MNGLFGFLIICLLAFGFQDYVNSQHKHEKEMLMLQKDTMPVDSIVTIQGNKYKLLKIK